MKIFLTIFYMIFLFDFNVNEQMRWTEKRKIEKKKNKVYYLINIFRVFIFFKYCEKIMHLNDYKN